MMLDTFFFDWYLYFLREDGIFTKQHYFYHVEAFFLLCNDSVIYESEKLDFSEWVLRVPEKQSCKFHSWEFAAKDVDK